VVIIATPTLAPALAPVAAALATVRRRQGAEGTRGLVPGLLVPAGEAGWVPAADLLAGGSDLDRLLAAAQARWSASEHAAVALAWRSYTYWLAMPVVLSWATARRVLLVAPDDVLVQVGGEQQLLRFGLRRLRLAVVADDPVPGGAGAPEPAPELVVLGSSEELLAITRRTLRDSHLDPLLAALQARARVGTRTLLGSLASAVAYGLVRGLAAPPAAIDASAQALLSALDVADLVALEPDPSGRLQVRRRTCCLAFTLPVPKICSGCCLRPAADFR
jgi:ferric iron reductase protein FhuF